MDSSVTWKNGMAFEANQDDVTFMIDSGPDSGGQGLGVRPKGLLLTALAGCTAMDVISILQKMRLPVTGLKVTADGLLTDEHPKRFTDITLRYEVNGEGVPLDRVKRAVELSQDKYCGVSATLRPGVNIHSEIWLNGEKQAV